MLKDSQKLETKKMKKKKNRRKSRFFNQGKLALTDFNCRDRAPGYYADMEANCEVSQWVST